MIRNSNDFGLKRVAEDQNGYYLIGYRPTDETSSKVPSPQGHRERTRTHGAHARRFFGIREESEKPVELTAGDQLKKALLSPFGANDITVRLTTMFTTLITDRCCARYFLSGSGPGLCRRTDGDIKRRLIWE